MKTTYPVNFSHVGHPVPNLEKAIQFYTEIFGWYHISGPIKVSEKEKNNLSRISELIYGKGWEEFRFAHLSTADGVRFELFEFTHNQTKKSVNDPFKTGIHHFCLQHPYPEELLERIVEGGGKIKMSPQIEYPEEKPYLMAFGEDPFGNSIEIYSHAYELHNVGPNGPIS